MPASVSTSGALTTFTVKVGGTAIPDAFRVFSLRIEKKLSRVPMANIVVLDGDASTGEFPASSSSTFVPGAEISIEAGYDNQNQLLFKGIITQQSIRIDETVGSALEVECYDAAIRMTVGRKSLTFSKQADSTIIASLINAYNGLEAKVVPTTTIWANQVQYYVSDWDFILARAEANGLVVNVLNGTVAVIKPDADTTSVVSVGYGNGLLAFNATMDSASQLGTATAISWDYPTQSISSCLKVNHFAGGAGNISSQKLSSVMHTGEYPLQTSAPMEMEDLSNWSDAQLVKSNYAKIQGTAKFQGSSMVEPARYMTISGVGDRFNGDYLISGVLHELSNGNWITQVSLGLSPNWYTENPSIMAPSASGLLPGARGLFSGTVKQNSQDPDGQYRVLVSLPLFDENGPGIWARLSNFYSTNGAGAFFLPEIGDEVVLGFMSEDPRYPIILGSLYSSPKNKPLQGLEPSAINGKKVMATKSGTKLEFDDEQKTISVVTPGNKKLALSDKENTISIEDENGNSIIMSNTGITIKSKKDINIEADQKINFKGTQGVTISSPGGDINIKGINISEQADSQYAAQGSETATVKGGMELTLKSAMIMIN